MIKRVPLSKVAQINPRLPKGTDESQDVSFLAMASVSEDGLVLEQETRVLKETRKGYTYFERGDVLLAKITPCFENGKAALTDSLEHQIGFGSTEFHVLRADPRQLDSKYLFYIVWNDHFRFLGEKSMQGAAGQKRVSVDFLKNFEIPLPPLDEQKRIAAILDKAGALRRKRQQAIDLADQFLRSVFLEMFGDPVTNPKGWRLAKMDTLVDCQLGKMLSKKSKLGESPKKYLRNANVRWGYFELGDLLEMDFSTKEQAKFELKDGDLLVCEGGEIGRCAIWRDQLEDCYFQKALHRIRVGDEVLPEYMQQYFYWMSILGGFSKTVSEVTFSHLTSQKLKQLDVPVPPKELQEKFTQVCAGIEQLKSRLTQVKSENNSLFSSISLEAFRSEL
ncbi:restriction endonuclease subunit S [Marinobacterium stanieri]|uniref:restriction endonuclease subunit S n=1 Tax=Marinobacterium stanieri TaxID=49186 RepID=UPI003A8DEAAA